MKCSHLRLGVFCFASAALYLPSHVSAQQQPPTVSNIPAEQLRQPTRDEVGLWQLLSNQNNPNMVCGDSKSIAVVKATGQVVCVSPTPAASNTPASPAVNPNTANKRSAALNKAEAEKQLAAAEAEEERIRSMHEKADVAVKKAEATLESANKKADALQEEADATDDPQEKLSLLKEQLKLKKTMLPVIQQRDKMRETATQLQGQLKQAEQQTALARSKLEEANQATAVASRQQPIKTLSSPQLSSQSENHVEASTNQLGGERKEYAKKLTRLENVDPPSNQIAVPKLATGDRSAHTTPVSQSRSPLATDQIAKITQPDPTRFYKDTDGLTGSCVSYAKNVYFNMTGKEIGPVGTAANMINVAKANNLPYLPRTADPGKIPVPSLAVWGPSGSNNAGHVAVVTAVNGNEITVKEANFGQNMLRDGTYRTDKYGEVTESTISLEEFNNRSGSTLLGYITK